MSSPSTPISDHRRDGSWVDDSILDGFQQLTIPLPGARMAPGEPESSPPTGTLVRRHPPQRRSALLYLHGWSDYFFQSHLAEAVERMGHDFHALELRRYGRSLAPGQLAGFVGTLDDYFEELDRAVGILREDHDQVVLMGHSTGGLTASLWADARPGAIDALVLNSPWLDLQASWVVAVLTGRVTRMLSVSRPTAVLKLPDNGFYLRSLDPATGGEWEVDPALKGPENFFVRAGWLAAVLAGHDRVAKGLSIEAPVLLLTSGRSDFRRVWDEAMREADTVLDVERIMARGAQLGDHVTLVRLPGGMHDLALSRGPVRDRYFDEVKRWLTAYLGLGREAH